MTIQALTIGDQDLAMTVANDMARYAWRRREALLSSTTIHTIKEGATLTRVAIARKETPDPCRGPISAGGTGVTGEPYLGSLAVGASPQPISRGRLIPRMACGWRQPQNISSR
jgi:hypothetical protein